MGLRQATKQKRVKQGTEGKSKTERPIQVGPDNIGSEQLAKIGDILISPLPTRPCAERLVITTLD